MRRTQHEKTLYENNHQDSSSSPTTTTSSSSFSTSTSTNSKSCFQDESRFSRVKRVFKAGSLLLGRANKNNDDDDDDNDDKTTRKNSKKNIKAIFGINLKQVELYNDTGIPYVVYRLCNYIEKYGFTSISVFRLSGGNPKLAEKLRNSFDKRGDADLETAACPATAATLLRQYFKELPQPLVPSSLVGQLLNIHSQFSNNRERWIESTNKLLQTLPKCHYQLLSYLINYLSKYESQHAGESCGVCGVFAPVILPHVPPATSLLRDIITESSILFSTCAKNLADYPTSISNNCPIEINNKTTTATVDGVDEKELLLDNKTNILLALKPRKRKEHSETCCQENKLIRSNSEERILVSSSTDTNIIKSIRRVSSHEDFKSFRNLHREMGHGVRCGTLPLHEQSTNVLPLPLPCDSIQLNERRECDVEDLRSTERFSRSITPHGRRRHQARRKKQTGQLSTPSSSSLSTAVASSIETIKNNEQESGETIISQSFLEMLSSGPSRSPSPARALARASDEDPNNPELTNWHYQHLTNESLDFTNNPNNDDDDDDDDEENAAAAASKVTRRVSPRNSQLIPSRRFYIASDNNQSNNDNNGDETRIKSINSDIDFKNMTKHINVLKKKIKKYEEEFENNYGYRPSHSDKMNNREIKKLCTELNKLRKEYKLLKEEDPIGILRHFNATLNKKNNKIDTASAILINNNINNNNLDKKKSTGILMEEMVNEMEKKLSDKRLKCNRNDNIEEYTHEELLDEKTALQKALLQIEGIFGRPVLKEDRVIVRPLYDRYRTLKRLLIRASSSKHKDSMSELATILEHEAMDFTSSSSAPAPTAGSTSSDSYHYERRASEPNMSHRGILDCIIDDDDDVDDNNDTTVSTPTPTTTTDSSTTTTTSTNEILHSMSHEDLILQQGIIKEEKKRLRRALKELELQFEAQTGRKMLKQDRGSQIQNIYDSYKQTKGKLRLIHALIAKATKDGLNKKI